MDATARDFIEIGRQAYRDGAPSAPIFNAAVHDAIADLPVGGGARQIMKDFQQGWEELSLREAFLALADD